MAKFAFLNELQLKWWINKHTPSEDWFAGNDTPASFNLKDSRARNGERVQFASPQDGLAICSGNANLSQQANVSIVNNSFPDMLGCLIVYMLYCVRLNAHVNTNEMNVEGVTLWLIGVRSERCQPATLGNVASLAQPSLAQLRLVCFTSVSDHFFRE